MYITSRYMGVKLYDNDYLFFILTDDYYTSQKKIAAVIDDALHSLARDLEKGDGLVVMPSKGDEKATKYDVLDRNWTDGELVQIRKVPGILIIKEDFDKFDPRLHHWYYFSLQDIMTEYGDIEIKSLFDLFTKLSDATKRNNLFDITDEIAREKAMKGLYDAFEFKPSAFGLSFDVKKGLEFFGWIEKEARARPWWQFWK